MKRRAWWGCGALLLCGIAIASLNRWIASTELPNLEPAVSQTVLDREGRLLRAYTVADGRWRLPVDLAQVDTGYIDQLIAYEDKRFRSHWGVDPLAALQEGHDLLVCQPTPIS